MYIAHLNYLNNMNVLVLITISLFIFSSCNELLRYLDTLGIAAIPEDIHEIHTDEVVKSFLEGIQILNNIQETDCKFTELHEIKNTIIDIIDGLESDLAPKDIQAVATSFANIPADLMRVRGHCERFARQIIKEFIKAGISFVPGRSWISYRAPSERERMELRDKVNRAHELKEHGDYHEAGKIFGEAIYYLLLKGT
jgi:hypothetical protein